MSDQPSGKQLAIGAALAAVVAVVALVFFVLPAEFGVDPTGAGEATGLTGLSTAGEMTELERGALREGVLTISEEKMREDRRLFELAPFQSLEYKYTLAEGASVYFSWQATGELNYDMHAHPFEGGEALTESYSIDAAESMTGLYVAPFTGIHGWYWQNRTMANVTLVINAAGAFTTSTVFDEFGETEEEIDPVK